jgi:DNA-binding beta-propeller fold protein YncE
MRQPRQTLLAAGLIAVALAATVTALSAAGRSAARECDRMALPSQPRSLALVGNRVWVTSKGGVQLFDLISCRSVGNVIHMPKRARVTPPPQQAGWMWGLDEAWAVVSDRRHLWIAGDLSLYRADPITRKIVRPLTLFRIDRIGNATKRVPLGFLGMTLRGGSLWAANWAEGETTIYEIDADSGKVKLKRPGDSEIVGMASGAGRVWAISHDRSTLLRIDPRNGRFTRTKLSSEPHGVAFGAGYIWVAMYHQSRILRVDPSTGRVAGKPIRVGFPPEPMAAADRRLWAIPSAGGFLSDPSRHEVLEIDAGSGRIFKSFQAKGQPRAVVALGETAWVATSHPNELVRFGR